MVWDTLINGKKEITIRQTILPLLLLPVPQPIHTKLNVESLADGIHILVVETDRDVVARKFNTVRK